MKNGRIAVPSEGLGGLEGQRSAHFGHCSTFTLIDVVDGEISNVSTISNQEHREGGCLVPVNILAGQNVNALIVSGIGMRPLVGFNNVNISVHYEATQPSIQTVVKMMISGELPEMEAKNACGGGGAH
ncbi:MAG: NifB/NifX family molybdenum-iron cluster-binding protein [Candidatus Cloacimonetes bacterium]|nr:NifB/NifX family molybdenum-iron cluster-binding protein [Candidatus Cloacimonadota bacterium]